MGYVTTDREPARRVAGNTQSALPVARTSTHVDQTLDFDSFYTKHRNEIGSALAFTLGSRALGEEAVDEAMARAYQRWKTIGAYENSAGWVYRAGLNWGRSRQRSIFRRKRREDIVARSATDVVDLTGVRSELMEALTDLSFEQRSVVVLRYYCDWSVSETAEALKISEGTVKSRSARGLDQLRGTLSVDISEGGSA